MKWKLLLPAALFLISSPAAAETLTVLPDGSGDYPTIRDALDAAADGDVVELGNGTFRGEGNRDIDFPDKAVTVRSASGDPTLCVIDCEGSDTEPRRAFRFGSVSKSEASLEGITVTGGWIGSIPWGAAVLCESGSVPRIESCLFTGNAGSAVACTTGAAPRFTDCRFIGNEGAGGGGMRTAAASPAFTGCLFSGNEATGLGGAIRGHAGTASFTDCDFIGNHAGSGGVGFMIATGLFQFHDCLFEENSAGVGGGIEAMIGTMLFDGCTFSGNHAVSGSGALSMMKMSYATVRNCTFHGNDAPLGTIIMSEWHLLLENTIIAFGNGGPAISTERGVTLTCSDLFGNEGGDWVGPYADQLGLNGNISADPLFCDPPGGDFTLSGSSPCAPFSEPNPECDLVGAHPVGCGGTAVRPSSWSGVKGLFR